MFSAPKPANSNPTPSLFGTPAPAAGTSLFGAPAPASTPSFFGGTSSTPSLFGGAPAPTPAAGGSLFGAAPAPGSSLFGGTSTPGVGTSSLFGGTPAGSSLFGNPAPTAPGVNAGAPAAPAGPLVASDSDVFNAFLQQIGKAWDANDYRMCSFKYVFFDDLSQEGPNGQMVPPSAELLAAKHKEALERSDTGLLERSEARNPDPARFCPVQVTGFAKLHERHAQQQQMSAQVYKLVQTTKQELQQLADERQVTVGLRLRHYQARQLQLAHRIVALAAKLEALRLARTYPDGEPPLAASELKWADELKNLAQTVQQPERGRARLLALSAKLQASAPRVEAAAGSETLNLAALKEWLACHQEALERLVEIQQELATDAATALAEVARH